MPADVFRLHEGQVVIYGHSYHVVDGLDFLPRDHFADAFFHPGDHLFGFFDAGSGGRAEVELHQAGIHRREEIGPDDENNPDADRAQRATTIRVKTRC